MKIAVLLPAPYRGGTLRGALNVCRMIRLGAKAAGRSVDVVFGYLDDGVTYSPSDFVDLHKIGVSSRGFTYATTTDAEMSAYYDHWFNIPEERRAESYVYFADGVSDFEDADFWLIVSDRISHVLPPHRRYGVIVYDYIQRIVPDIFGKSDVTDPNWYHFEGYLRFARNAEFVICTTKQTFNDCAAYAGIERSRILLMPTEFDPISSEVYGTESANPYIVWTTNSTHHKNHYNILEGLDLFFERNKDTNISVHMTGVMTHLFLESSKGQPHFEDPYLIKIRSRIEKSHHLRQRLKIRGNLGDREYSLLLGQASVLLHGALYDNGTFSVIEAAWFGVPSVTSDYPAMREIEDRFSLPMNYFSPFVPEELAQRLAEVLADRDEWTSKLPTRAVLSGVTFDNVAPVYAARLLAKIEGAPL